MPGAKTGRHKSVDNKVKHHLLWLLEQPGAVKAVLGFSECCRHKYPPGTLRHKLDVAGGIKINAYSGNGVTDIFIKIDPIEQRELIKQKIAQRFSH